MKKHRDSQEESVIQPPSAQEDSTLDTCRPIALLQPPRERAGTLWVRTVQGGAALLLVLTLLLLTHFSAQAQECTAAACISTAAHLAELDSTESELLDPLLGALLGQDAALGLTAADYDALANANITLGALLERLQLDLGVATPEEVLEANLAMPQLIDALETLLPGNSGIAALQLLPDMAGPIVLGDLLQFSSPPGALGNVNLNLLDLLVGSIQLFNHSNAVAVQAVALDDGALTALGLPALGIDGVSLRAVVLEPPQIICGPAGTEFASANVRIALDVALDTAATELDELDLSVLTLSVTASPAITLASLSLYVDVASGTGTLQSVDANVPSATVNATPGIARIFLGDTATMDDFFAVDFDPATDLIPATIGALDVPTRVCLALLCSDLTLQSLISARTAAVGSSASQSQTFSGPFPQTHLFTASASSIATLLGQLVANLEVDIDLTVESGTLDPALLAILGGAIDPLLTAVETNLLTPLTTAVGTELVQDEVGDLLTAVVDPALDLLGVGIGKMVVTVFGANGDANFLICAPLLSVTLSHNPDPLRVGVPGALAIVVNNHADAGPTTGPISVTATLPPILTFSAHAPASWQRVGSSATPFLFVYNGVLEGGDSATLTLHLLPASAATASIAGAVATQGQTSTPFNHSVTIVPAGDGDGDSDGDGIPDDVECPEGTVPCPDTDGDGTPNHQDADDDGDGVYTVVECPGGVPCPDSDGDGTPDYLDADDDGDGIHTIIECPAGRISGSAPPCPNTDGDGLSDYLDTDDDNDGLTTRAECPAGRTSAGSPACPDSDGDGTPDYLDAVDDRIPPGQDSDGDGVPDGVECPNGLATCPDTDGDGTPDHQDPDDDGDGVGTIVECPGGPPCPDTDGDGTPDHRDVDDDGDGVHTIVECPDGRETMTDSACPNTDGDAHPNYLDPDDDNDGVSTRIECPNGRTSSTAARCPALGDPDLEDYLNPDFSLLMWLYAPLVHNMLILPTGE